MELKDLRPSLLELPDNEALNLILKIRVSRTESKRVTKERTPTPRKDSALLDPHNMTIEQLEMLVKNFSKEEDSGS